MTAREFEANQKKQAVDNIIDKSEIFTRFDPNDGTVQIDGWCNPEQLRAIMFRLKNPQLWDGDE